MSISAFASAGMAADLAAPVYKAPPPVIPAPAAYSWTGFYVGGHAGYGGTWLAGSGPNGSAEGILPGPIAGGQIGYNFQFRQFIVGVEGDLSWSNMRISSPISGGSVYIKDNYLATAAGRFGYALDRVTLFGLALNSILIYGKGGAAFIQEDWTITSNGAAAVGTFDRTGWMVGGGVEYALWGNWSVKAEYNYLDFGTLHEVLNRNNGRVFIVGNVDAHSHIGKAGINFRF